MPKEYDILRREIWNVKLSCPTINFRLHSDTFECVSCIVLQCLVTHCDILWCLTIGYFFPFSHLLHQMCRPRSDVIMMYNQIFVFLLQGHPGREGPPGEKGIQVGNCMSQKKKNIKRPFLATYITVHSLTLWLIIIIIIFQQ